MKRKDLVTYPVQVGVVATRDTNQVSSQGTQDPVAVEGGQDQHKGWNDSKTAET